MLRRISGFHEDLEGDWVAELDCLHSQHVRHRPPFQVRPWVLTPAGRGDHLGSAIECPLCDRAELPADLAVVRTAGPFDQETLPAGLRRAHQVPGGSWGRLQVLEGAVDFWMGTDPPIARRMTAGEQQPIPPQVSHEVRLSGLVRLQVDFLVRSKQR